MLTRRVFIGSTLGGLGLPASTIHGTLKVEEHNPDHTGHGWIPGYLKSFQWEFDKVEYGPVAFNPYRRYVAFPLQDRLHITFLRKMHNNSNEAMELQEVWEVFNWQLKGFAFDIIDFINIPLNQNGIIPGQPNDLHKIYKGMKFRLNNVSCGAILEFDGPHPNSCFLSPPYNLTKGIHYD